MTVNARSSVAPAGTARWAAGAGRAAVSSHCPARLAPPTVLFIATVSVYVPDVETLEGLAAMSG